MTTSTLFHTQGIRGFKYQKTQRIQGIEYYSVHSTASHLSCPCWYDKHIGYTKTGHIGYTLLLSFGVRSVEGFWIVRGDVGRRPEAALTIVG